MSKFLRHLLLHGVLAAAAVLVLLPLAWMLGSSFKSQGEIFKPPQALAEPHGGSGTLRVIGDVIWPDEPTLTNYKRLFRELPLGRATANTVFVSTSSTLLSLFFCSLGGFAFAKYRFPGRDKLFMILLGSMMIPGYMLFVPRFALMDKLGWFDTYTALIVPGAVHAFGIFLIRQYAMSIPDSLLDAGRMDGCSEFRLYWNICLPLLRPALGVLTIFVFMGAWNSFMWPLIVLRDSARYTLPLMLGSLVGVYQQEYGILMAGTLVAMLPIILLFASMQREFVSGLALGAVKE